MQIRRLQKSSFALNRQVYVFQKLRISVLLQELFHQIASIKLQKDGEWHNECDYLLGFDSKSKIKLGSTVSMDGALVVGVVVRGC
jgi:hypothetical protein